MKRCTRCHAEKSEGEFPSDPQRVDGLYPWCRSCKREYMQDRRTPEKDFESNLRRACKRHGISVEDYYRQLEEQGGRCAICRTDTPSYRTTRFAFDHDHRTGKFRALLCGPCNTGLGQFGDELERLEAAVEYLRKHLTRS